MSRCLAKFSRVYPATVRSVVATRGRRPGSKSSAWSVLLAGLCSLLALAGCSEGESDLLNPKSPRGDIAPPPETLLVATSDLDRSFRPRTPTGTSPVLFLSREGEIHSEIYLRFDLGDLADTSDVVNAEIGLRFRRTQVGPVLLEAFAVSADAEEWTEEALDQPLPTGEVLPTTSAPIAPAAGDTLYVKDAVRLPGSLIRRWKLDSASNRGVVIRLADASVARSIEVMSKEASLADTSGNLLVNPRLEIFRGEDRTSVLESAEDDAYVLTDGRTPSPGDATTFTTSSRPAERGLVRFALPALLRRGDTINRATLRLRVEPSSVSAGESLLVGAYLATTAWDEAAQPDSVSRGSAGFDFERVRASSDTIALDCALAVQRWLDAGENFGLQIRSATENDDTTSVRFFTREAEAALRPTLQIVYTPPPDPRWGGVAP